MALTQFCIAYGDHYGMASCVLVFHCGAGYVCSTDTVLLYTEINA